jgi:hypothetical protein
VSEDLGARWLSTIDINGMYDAPGLLKPWYFLLRLFEEITRSKRYQRQVTLVMVNVPTEASQQLELWFTSRLRATDLLCRDALGGYFILLPETGEASASHLAKRLRGAFSYASISMGTLPGDPDLFTELADQITVESATKAA